MLGIYKTEKKSRSIIKIRTTFKKHFKLLSFDKKAKIMYGYLKGIYLVVKSEAIPSLRCPNREIRT
tara:strand:- start:91 stop:288 length:198 start_codon:yes stop_codon:yes gene_type:complete